MEGNDEIGLLPIDELEKKYRRLLAQHEELRTAFSTNETELIQLRAEAADFEDFYNNAPFGYHLLDENGLIIKMNKTELDWLGYQPEEVIGKRHMTDMFSDKGVLSFYKYQADVQIKGHAEFEGEYIRKDRTIYERTAKVRGVFDAQGTFKGVRVTLWDNTQYKKTEEEMLKANRQFRDIKQRIDEKNASLENLNYELDILKEEKRRLITSIEDRLQKPLYDIATLCNQLLDLPAADAVQQRNGLLQVSEAVNTLCRNVGDYEVQQRLSSDESLRISDFSLSSLLVTSVNRFDDLAAGKSVALNCEIFEELKITTDREYLTQVLDKLLSSAINYMSAAGEIDVRLFKEAGSYTIELETKETSRELASGLYADRKERKQSFPAGAEYVPNWDLAMVNVLVRKMGYRLLVTARSTTDFIARLEIPQY